MNYVLSMMRQTCASRIAQSILLACLLLLATHSAEAQKPKLKLLEHNLPEDSSISCSPGPYYVEESVQRRPGELVDERLVYSHNRWSVLVRELSVSAVADEFSKHVGDTVTVESCEYLPDSSRAVLRRFVEAHGPCRLRRAGSSSNPTEPLLEYDIIFDEPTQFGPVFDYVMFMQEDRRTVIAISNMPGCDVITRAVTNDRAFDPRRTTEYLYNNGILDTYGPATISSRTRGWALYSIKAPMAWDVTMGQADVIIGGNDAQQGCQDLDNIDLVKRETAAGTGNIRSTVGTLTAAALGINSTPGDGLRERSIAPLRSTFNGVGESQHSIETITAAVGRADNDNLANPTASPEGSAAGSAPKCDGILILRDDLGVTCNGYDATQRVETILQAIDVDLDFVDDANNQRSRVDVIYNSYSGSTLGLEGVDAVNLGVVLVASAGNDHPTIPGVTMPAADQFLHATDHKLDTKIIAVASVSDGAS